MEQFHSLEGLPDFGETTVAVGYFDGVHLGHQAVIRAAEENSARKSIVFSFTTGSEEKEDVGKGAPRLITLEEKARLCAQLGVDYLVTPSFSAIKELSPRAFVEEILKGKLQAKEISCGYDFHFGKNAEGNGVLMEQFCEENGILLKQHDPVDYEGAPISTSRIRRDLSEGKIDQVNNMLGRLISYHSEVVHGEKLGRKLGFPTANQFFASHQAIPLYGIYASIVEIDGKRYPGVTNIGIKPTIEGQHQPNMETFIEEFSGNLYGKDVRVGLYKFLRSEQKFKDIDALKGQIGIDAEHAKSMITEDFLNDCKL